MWTTSNPKLNPAERRPEAIRLQSGGTAEPRLHQRAACGKRDPKPRRRRVSIRGEHEKGYQDRFQVLHIHGVLQRKRSKGDHGAETVKTGAFSDPNYNAVTCDRVQWHDVGPGYPSRSQASERHDALSRPYPRACFDANWFRKERVHKKDWSRDHPFWNKDCRFWVF